MIQRVLVTWIMMGAAIGVILPAATSNERLVGHARTGLARVDLREGPVSLGSAVEKENEDLWLAMVMHAAETAPLAARFAGLNLTEDE